MYVCICIYIYIYREREREILEQLHGVLGGRGDQALDVLAHTTCSNSIHVILLIIIIIILHNITYNYNSSL